MPEFPVLRYSCKHVGSKKVVNREYSYGGVITSIDLCKECANDPDFLDRNDSYKDAKITKQSKSKPLTIPQLKKAILKRQQEVKAFDKEISNIWHESDKLDKVDKMLEICVLNVIKKGLEENHLRRTAKILTKKILNEKTSATYNY